MALFVSTTGGNHAQAEFDQLADDITRDRDHDGRDDLTRADLHPEARFKEPDPSEWMMEVPPRKRRYSQEEAYKPQRWGERWGAPVRRKIWLTFEEPGYSPMALMVNLSITLLILVAITAFTIETFPAYYGRDVAPFPQVEMVCTTVFTVEVFLRGISCPDFVAFIKNWWNIADLLAILPYYLELTLGRSSRGYAVVRVVRLVRLLKLVRYGQRNKKMGGMLKVFRETMQESESNLKMMIMFELLTMVICGAVTYYIERGTFHKDSSSCAELLLDSYRDEHEVARIADVIEAEEACDAGPEGAGWCQYFPGVDGAIGTCGSATGKFCEGVDRLAANCQDDQSLLDQNWYFTKVVRKTVGFSRGSTDGDCVAPDGSTACDTGDNDEVACVMRGLTDAPNGSGQPCRWQPGEWLDPDDKTQWAAHTVLEAMDRAGEEEVMKKAMFPTIFTGMYWTLVTVTGVGYGDMVPTSVAGKFATFITILMGLLLIALPVSVIGGNFQACYMRLIDSEAKQQSSTTASAAAFQMSGLRFRLRSHRNGVEDLRKEHPIPVEATEPAADGEGELRSPSNRRGSVDILKAQVAQINDLGPRVAESPAKRNTKGVSLAGVRTTRDLAKRLAPSDVCASMYMEHLLRALHIADDHFSEAMGECIDTQFIGVLEHTHKHVMGEDTTEDDYDAERAEWSPELWAHTGSGLREDFTRTGANRPGTSTDVNRSREGTGEFPLPTTAEESVEEALSAAGSGSEKKDVSDMSTNEMDAEVDSLMTSQTELEQGRAPRLP